MNLKRKYEKLNLGCGKNTMEDYLNVDIVDSPHVDLQINLNTRPWELPSNQYREILLDNVLEHLDDTVSVMEELQRIIRSDGIIIIIVPYFASYLAYQDPTHKNFFSYKSFEYFTDDFEYNFYSTARFQIKERKIICTGANYGLFFRPLEMIINKFPEIYERFFCYMFPCNKLYVELTPSN